MKTILAGDRLKPNSNTILSLGVLMRRKSKNSDLRRQAEEKFSREKQKSSRLNSEDSAFLTEELRVHQIELEVQNEDLRQSQSDLIQARDKYQDLFESVPVGYFILNCHNNTIIEANQTAADLLSTTRSVLYKKRFTVLIAEGSLKTYYLEVTLATGERKPREFDLEMVRENGSRFFAQLNITAMKDEEGKYSRLRISVADITRRKEIEKELKNYIRELEAISYSMSHNLKAPLRSMNGFSQALLEDYNDKLDDRGRKYLQFICSSSQLMGNMIDGLWALSTVTRVQMNVEEINLSELASEVELELNRSSPERQVEFKIQPGLKDNGDRHLIKTVLKNLLENASKFTGKCSQPLIEFGMQKDGELLVYFVRDNGVGFDQTYADKLFKPFQRLHSEAEYPGVGIGLAYAERIVRRHGGRMWAQGEKGQGATFYFTLR